MDAPTHDPQPDVELEIETVAVHEPPAVESANLEIVRESQRLEWYRERVALQKQLQVLEQQRRNTPPSNHRRVEDLERQLARVQRTLQGLNRSLKASLLGHS